MYVGGGKVIVHTGLRGLLRMELGIFACDAKYSLVAISATKPSRYKSSSPMITGPISVALFVITGLASNKSP